MIGFFLCGSLISFIFYVVLVLTHRKWFKRSFIGDTSWHFLMIKSFKERKKYDGIPELIMRDGPDAYPRFFHWLCSCFSLEVLKKYQFIPNLIISVIFYGILYFYIFYIAENKWCNQLYYVFFVFSLFLFSQSHQYCLKGDKILNIQLSERLLASLCVSLYYLALYFVITAQDIFSFILVVVFGALSWVVSLFSRQAIVFSSILVSLLLCSFIPIFSVVISYLAAAIFDFKYLNRGIMQQFQFLYTYNSFFKKGTLLKSVLSKGYPSFRKMLQSKTIGEFLYSIYSSPPINFIYANPDILFLGIYLLYVGETKVEFTFFFTPVLLYALISSKKLHFLGGAERYMHYLLKFYNPFLFLILVKKTANPMPIFLVVGFYTLVMLLKYANYNRKINISNVDLLSEILDNVSLSKENVFFCIPQTLGSSVVARKDCKALSHQGVRYPLKYMKTVVSDPPFLDHNWHRIFKDYSITHVLVDKNIDQAIRNSCNWSYNYDELTKISENSTYIIYSVPRTEREKYCVS